MLKRTKLWWLSRIDREPDIPIGAGLPEKDNLVDQLRGRARFLRDRNEVKTPQLLEQAAAKLSLQSAR